MTATTQDVVFTGETIGTGDIPKSPGVPNGDVYAVVTEILHYDVRGIGDDQAWFLSTDWQAKEREADDDIAAGRTKIFDNFEDFLAELDEDD